MKACLNLQNQIYDCYSLAIYNKIKKLSKEEKEGLTLYIRIEKGCSFIKILTNKVIEEIVDKMNGTQIFASIAIIVAGLTISRIHNSNSAIKLKEIEQKTIQMARESESADFKQYSQSLEKIALTSLNTNKIFLETLSEIDGDISIQEAYVSKEEFQERIKTISEVTDEIKNENSTNKQFEFFIEEGNFQITNISIPDDGDGSYVIAIKNKDKIYSGIVLAEHHITEEQQEILTSSLMQKPVYMKIEFKKNIKNNKLKATLKEIQKIDDQNVYVQGKLFD